MKKLNNIVVSKSEVQDKSSLWLQPNNSGSADLKYSGSKGWSSVSSGVKNIVWTETSKVSDYLEPGIYVCEDARRYSLADELPITNEGEYAGIGFTLIVNSTVNNLNGNHHQLIGQTLILTNRLGGETKQYIRSLKYTINNAATTPEVTENIWTPWKELKGTTNLNTISNEDLKSMTENGIYEGAIIDSYDQNSPMYEKFLADLSASKQAYKLPTGTLFTMEVLNNYAVVNTAASMGMDVPVSISQKAKCLLINGSYVEVIRKSINDRWTEWIAADYEI